MINEKEDKTNAKRKYPCPGVTCRVYGSDKPQSGGSKPLLIMVSLWKSEANVVSV